MNIGDTRSRCKTSSSKTEAIREEQEPDTRVEM